MKLNVITLANDQAGEIELSDEVFGITDIRGDILQRCVTWQLAKRRSGNHKIKTRNEVARTGKKMYKQKGTGGARHGSRKAAQFVGGAKTHGPVVRSHEFSLTKKLRALAMRHALSSKAKAGTLVVVDALTLDAPKTAALRAQFETIGLKNALMIAGPEVDANFKLAARNIPLIDVLPNAGLNVYDVLRRDTLVLTRSAVEAIEARFSERGLRPNRRKPPDGRDRPPLRCHPGAAHHREGDRPLGAEQGRVQAWPTTPPRTRSPQPSKSCSRSTFSRSTR